MFVIDLFKVAKEQNFVVCKDKIVNFKEILSC